MATTLGLLTMSDMREAFGGVSRQTITNWVREGQLLPPIHVGRRVFWREGDVRLWLQRHPPLRWRYHGNVLPWERDSE